MVGDQSCDLAAEEKVEEMHGGTHGSLARDETIGYLMSNHTPSTALPSHLVREDHQGSASQQADGNQR